MAAKLEAVSDPLVALSPGIGSICGVVVVVVVGAVDYVVIIGRRGR